MPISKNSQTMLPSLSPISLAATTLAALFISAPMTVIPLLDRSARMDMIDLYEAGMAAQSGNRYGGVSTMTHCSDSLITVHLTDVSTMTLQLVNDSVVELSHKVFTKDVEHVTSHLYDHHWHRIKP